ncbi:MAG TPA: malto-oligosyltrehalose trehalohydrolase, partial [Planctomycetota bacterium]|nr:malto-oligosyltrehalose trehalohydrolase [Planctomycetota bacterium]
IPLERVLLVRRGPFAIVHHFGRARAPTLVPLAAGRWEVVLDSAAPRFGGPGSGLPAALASKGEVTLDLAPLSFALLLKA